MLVEKIILGEEMKPYLEAMRSRVGGFQRIYVDFSSETSSMNEHDLCVRFKPATRDLFLNYSWPGNTRELESVLDTLILKAFYDLQISESKSRRIEIDHYYALSLLGEIEKSSHSTFPEVRDEDSQNSHENAGFQNIGVMTDFGQLRQTLEKRYLCEVYQQCEGDLGRMGMQLFGDSSESMKHKISVRFNQLGLRIRSMKKK